MQPDGPGTGETATGHWEVFAQTGELFWSDEVYRIHGLEPGEKIDIEAAIKAYHQEDQVRVAEFVRQALEEKKDYQFDLRLIRADGEVRHVRSTGVVRLDTNGDVRSVFGTFQDITERKRTQEALAASEERFRDMAANVPGVVYQFRMETTGTLSFPYVSPAIERVLGIEAAAVVEDPNKLLDLIDPDDRPNWEALIIASHENLEPWIWEGRMRRSDGEFGWFRGSSIPRELEDSSILWNGLLLDITGRKEAELALQESERTLKEAQKIAGLGYWSWILETDETVWSEECYRILGLDPAEVNPSGQLFKSLVEPEDRDQVSRRAEAALENDAPYAVEYRVCRSSGDVRFIYEQAQVKRDAHGHPISMHGTLLDITERKKSEQALRTSEARYKVIVEDQTELISRLSPDGRHTFVNQAFCRFVGKSAAELVGTPLFNYVHLDQRESLEARLADFTPKSNRLEFETQLLRDDGEYRWIAWIDRAIYDHRGRLIEIQSVGRDVTDQKVMQVALRESESRYRTIFDTATVGIGRTRLRDGSIVLANQTLARMFGYNSLDEFQSEFIFSDHYVNPEDRARLLASYQKSPGTPIESSFTKRDGTIVTVQAHAMANNTLGILDFVATDITEQKRFELKLKDSEERFRRAVVDAPIPVIMHTEDGEILMVSRKWVELSGYALADIPTILDWTEKAYGTDKQQMKLQREAISAIFDSEGPSEHESEITTASGEKRMWEVRDAPLGRLADGRRFVISMIVDVTERKQALEALSASEERFRGIIENSSSAVFLKDLEGRFQLVNSRFEEWHGAPAAEAIGRTYFEVYTKEHAELYTSLDRDVIDSNAALEREFEMLFQDGRTHRVIVTKFPVRGSDDGVVGVGTIVTDVTAQREVEERLHQAQKMEAVGQLTGGVAHDFNNLLAVICGNAELLADEPGADASLTLPLLRAVERGVELTHRLLAFSRRQPLRPKAIDIQALVSGMSTLLTRALGAPVEIVIKAAPGLRPALADPGQVENALLNLSINARDAMPGGGKLTIECANAYLDSAYVAENPEALAGDYVVLAVSDTGTGMSPEIQAHAFEPFYSTKEVGQGSGLGLSMVYGFAKQSGGHVIIYSEEGRGTTVKLYLPRAPEGLITEDQKPDKEMPEGQGEVILVIEDDPDVRALAVRLLKRLSYQVIDVPDAACAREVLAAQQKVDLVLSDVVLPGGTSGPEFAEEARAARPDLKIIFMSGYPVQAAQRIGVLSADWVLLNKPFERHQLAKALRQALD